MAVSWYMVSCILFDDDDITQAAEHYYTANSDSGKALHWYADASHPYGEPLLEQVYGLQRGARYLVARASTDVYFLYPVGAASWAEAVNQQRGPFRKAELQQELLVLHEDTVLREVDAF